MKTKTRRVTVFYWLISITLVSWCFAMLYIYSWRSSWAGKIEPEQSAKREESALRDKIGILEEMDAPDHDIVEARISLTKLLFFLGDFNGGRYAVDDADTRLTSSKVALDKEAQLVQRVRLNKLAAVSFRDTGLYKFAQDRYDKISKLLDQSSGAEHEDSKSQVQYLQIGLLNEQAVLHYIWANASKEEVERKKHFALAQSLFEKCSQQSRMHVNESDGAKYRRLDELSQANLSELAKDLRDRRGV